MTDFIPHQLNKLKAELLEVSGIKHIIPSDCKRIAASIYAKTRLQISETTLKRLFGFASSNFKPSAFTVNAVALYCGYTGWQNFEDCFNQNKPKRAFKTLNQSWYDLRNHTNKTTGDMLRALQNRSGIPFQKTISRDFLDKHLHIFGTEKYTGTILSAPAGYGKTISLCHWVSERINHNNNQDIIAYHQCSTGAPCTITSKHVASLLFPLTAGSNDTNAIDNDFFNEVKPEGNFYFIIDGLNDCEYKESDFLHLFTQLIDIASAFKEFSWFKLIISMRSETWINCRQLLRDDDAIWFYGFMNGHQQAINVPLFNTREIEQLTFKINPMNIGSFRKTDYQTLSHPLYFQYYYLQNWGKFNISNVNQSTLYDLTTAFIIQQVYAGQYADDRSVLLHELIVNLEMVNGCFVINKSKVSDLLFNYKYAYGELLSVRLLKTANIIGQRSCQNYLEFANQHFLHFFIADKLINENEGRFDHNLIKLIETAAVPVTNRLAIIKWCVYNFDQSGQNIDLNCLNNSFLKADDRAEILTLHNLLSSRLTAGGLSNVYYADHDSTILLRYSSNEFQNDDPTIITAIAG